VGVEGVQCRKRGEVREIVRKWLIQQSTICKRILPKICQNQHLSEIYKALNMIDGESTTAKTPIRCEPRNMPEMRETPRDAAIRQNQAMAQRSTLPGTSTETEQSARAGVYRGFAHTVVSRCGFTNNASWEMGGKWVSWRENAQSWRKSPWQTSKLA